MNWRLLLYNSLLVVVALDAIANLIAAFFMSGVQSATGRRMTKAFFAAASEALATALTMGMLPPSARIVVWVVVVRIATRVYKTWTMAAVALDLLGYINGDQDNPPPTS